MKTKLILLVVSLLLAVNAFTTVRQVKASQVYSSSVLNFPPVAGGATYDLYISSTRKFPAGSPCMVGVEPRVLMPNSSYMCWVDADGSIAIRFIPLVSSDPPAGKYNVIVVEIQPVEEMNGE